MTSKRLRVSHSKYLCRYGDNLGYRKPYVREASHARIPSCTPVRSGRYCEQVTAEIRGSRRCRDKAGREDKRLSVQHVHTVCAVEEDKVVERLPMSAVSGPSDWAPMQISLIGATLRLQRKHSLCLTAWSRIPPQSSTYHDGLLLTSAHTRLGCLGLRCSSKKWLK